MTTAAASWLAVGVGWFAWSLAGLARLRAGGRLRRSSGATVSAALARLGRAVRVVATRRRTAQEKHDVRWGAAVVLAGVSVLLGPVPGAIAAVSCWLVPGWRRLHAARRATWTATVELPEVVDLVRLAVSAGLTVAEAIRVVARAGTGPIARALGVAVARVDRGAPLADALDAALAREETARPLVRALVGSEIYGTALDASLAELGAIARHDRRRRIETRARQVSVRLLLPLVLLILPAFVILTIVPSLVTSFSRLR